MWCSCIQCMYLNYEGVKQHVNRLVNNRHDVFMELLLNNVSELTRTSVYKTSIQLRRINCTKCLSTMRR